ncbi:uncharacterized protein LOC117324381 [Pecten maximus]|uniref:uncharacterized protein LOC117324381 n=1 Tax=Pecten maximus TaxID=6579 RepID=UPI00145839DF|nr:uncharacterized protein LOC117324381 [Pecten maximus]
MSSWTSIRRNGHQWFYRSSVRLEPRVSKIHRSEVNINVNQIIHTETIHIQCVPKIGRYSQYSLSTDGKITRSTKNIDYSMTYTTYKHTHSMSDKGRPLLYNCEILTCLPFSKLREVYHSRAIQLPASIYHSDSNSDSYIDNDDTLNIVTDDFPKVSGEPLTMSTPIVSRHLSERNPQVFEYDSISYLYEFDSLDSLFSKDSTISGDDVTDFQSPRYKNEVLILGLHFKKKRYLNTSKVLKGILKKRSK